MGSVRLWFLLQQYERTWEKDDCLAVIQALPEDPDKRVQILLRMARPPTAGTLGIIAIVAGELAKMGPPVVERLLALLMELADRSNRPFDDTAQQEYYVRIAIITALGAIQDPRAVEPLSRLLQRNIDASECIEAFENIGRPAVAVMIDYLQSNDDISAYRMTQALGHIGDPRAIAPLMQKLPRNDSMLEAAMKALAELGHTPAAPRMIETLIERERGEQRYDSFAAQAAAEALATLNSPEYSNAAFELLAGRLKSKDKDICEFAAKLLVHLRHPGTVDLLLATLNDSDPVHRCAALKSLASLPDPRAFDPLLAICQSSSAEEHEMFLAPAALGRLKDRRAVPPLVELLRHPDFRVRDAAAVALGDIGDPAAAAPLVDAAMANFRYLEGSAQMNALRAIGADQVLRAAELHLKSLRQKDRYCTDRIVELLKEPKAA